MTLGKQPGDDPRPLPRRPALMSVEPSQSREFVGRRRTAGKRRTVSCDVKCLPWWCGTGCCPFLVWKYTHNSARQPVSKSRISEVSWIFEQSKNGTQHQLKHISSRFYPVAANWVKVAAALGCFSLHWFSDMKRMSVSLYTVSTGQFRDAVLSRHCWQTNFNKEGCWH